MSDAGIQMPADGQRVRAEYLRWFRRHAVVLAAPIASLAWGQFAIASLPAWPQPPAGLRSMLLALAAGSVVFGRALKKRAVDAGSGDVFVAARRLSRDLAVAAVAPSVVGAVLVPMTRSVLDLYLTLGFSLLGCATMFPRASDWARWIGVRHGSEGDA
ncbi:MAG: hypothetical protein QMD96_03860 [Anaerosomatales bacterium]|nr:hypothetical protein [Anaerosomatales bacterium]